jgi:hypothetical protein
VGNLWSVAKINKENTGGGEGVIYLKTEEFQDKKDLFPNCTSGYYSKKLIKVQKKVPWWVLLVVPKGKLELYEETWTSFPYSKSHISVINIQVVLFLLN